MMDPNKRGNPPFEPSSYAAGLERRLKRHEAWQRQALDMARTFIDGSFEEQGLAAEWWREQMNPPQVVLSDTQSLPTPTDPMSMER
jgi:hypothetical protein